MTDLSRRITNSKVYMLRWEMVCCGDQSIGRSYETLLGLPGASPISRSHIECSERCIERAKKPKATKLFVCRISCPFGLFDVFSRAVHFGMIRVDGSVNWLL